jgi:hypothetical protein
MKLLKYHLMTHIVWVIEKFGLFKAVDTERSEAAHKAHKQAGMLTTRNAAYFEADVAIGFHDREVIKAATQTGVIPNDTPTIHVGFGHDGPKIEGRRHYINATGCFLHPEKRSDEPKRLSWGEVTLTNTIIAFLQREVLIRHGIVELDLFTMATLTLYRQNKYTSTMEGFKFVLRAHPKYKCHAARRGYPIFHWVYLKKTKKVKKRLCRCLAFCFIDGCEFIVAQCNNKEPYLIGNGVQEIVWGLTLPANEYQLIAMSDVTKTAVVIPNNLDQPEPITKWLLVQEQDGWHDLFSLEMRQRTGISKI